MHALIAALFAKMVYSLLGRRARRKIETYLDLMQRLEEV